MSFRSVDRIIVTKTLIYIWILFAKDLNFTLKASVSHRHFSEARCFVLIKTWTAFKRNERPVALAENVQIEYFFSKIFKKSYFYIFAGSFKSQLIGYLGGT